MQELRKEWNNERDKLRVAFDRIIQTKNNKSNKKNQSKTLNFYDSAKYQTLTIPPIVNQHDSLDNQIEIDNDLEVLPAASNIPQPSVSSASSNVPASSRKRSHDENCLLVCINCLEKVKEKRPKKICASESLSATLTSLYPNFPQDKVYLPQIICQSCSTKVKDSSAEVSVKYTALVFSVKLSKCFNKDVNDKVCEMCRIASANINPVKSSFLLKCKPNPGRPAKMVQRKITDFSGFQKIKSKKRKFQVLNECLSPKTQQQYVAQYLGENADKNGEVSLSRLHGPRMKFPIAFQKNAKTIISHETMLKIKKEINLSGNKSIILSQMLTTETDGLKLEKYFKQAVIDMPKKVKEYFDFTTVEMDVYDQVDFQYWRLSRGNLIAKNGQNHSEDIIVTLPDVGKPGLIQDIHSGQVLTLKMNGQVIFSDKIKIVQKTHTTRSAKKIISLRASKSGTPHPTRPTMRSEFSESQSWITGPANSQGWFRILHSKTGKHLTSSDSKNMFCEDLIDPSENPKKRVSIKVKKDIGYCHTEAFLTHVVEERKYEEDSELKIEMGLDGGKGSLKLCMSVEEVKLGGGDFGPPLPKKKKTGKWHSRHKDRGVKKIFVNCLVREVAETYHNFSVLLKLSGLDYFGFVMDFKATRICLGQQNCAATFPCPYCLGKKPFDGKPTLRTFQMLFDDASGYKALVADVGEDKARKLAYKYNSQVEFSLIKGDFPAQLVLFKVLLDELHIFLGVGNHIFDDLHKALVEDIDYEFHETCYKWAEDNSLVGLKYRGGQLGQLISE